MEFLANFLLALLNIFPQTIIDLVVVFTAFCIMEYNSANYIANYNVTLPKCIRYVFSNLKVRIFVLGFIHCLQFLSSLANRMILAKKQIQK